MPDISVVLKEAFPLGGVGPTVRRWWPLVLTASVAAATVWAAGAAWFGLVVGGAGVPLEYAGTDAGVIPWGYATAVLAIVALVLVIAATVRPAFARGRTWASGVLGLAAVLAIAVWIAPDLMIGGVTIPEVVGGPRGATPSFIAKSGLVTTIVATSVGSGILFMFRRNRGLDSMRRRA